eukprot:TRINITY_DN45425_c0_g1_i1.p1 TRINITY_DN45425_c0_g1~~TRINITY_DN45425_c0_g1_i1.p1  ORF type:complete len:848 (-),score=85.63 TRINITY_DN45425_c0_g1_i1:142-2685(-)
MASFTIRILIESASGLPNKDPVLFGVSDPYCVCEIVDREGATCQTNVLKDTLAPCWNYEHTFNGFTAGDFLRFAVFDKDEWPKKDDFLGQATLPGARIIPDGFDGLLGLDGEGGQGQLKIKIDVMPSESKTARSAKVDHNSANDVSSSATVAGPTPTSETAGSSPPSANDARLAPASLGQPARSASAETPLEEEGKLTSRQGKECHVADSGMTLVFEQGLAAMPSAVGYESLEWLNIVVSKLWCKVEIAVQTLLRQTVEPSIQEAMPAGFRGIHFSKFTLGKAKPRFGPLRILDRFGGRAIELVLGVTFDSDCDIAITVAMASAGIRRLRLRGELVIKLHPLIDEMPVVGGISMYFLDTPQIDLDFTGLGNIADCPGLARVVRNAISSAVAGVLTLPNVISVCVGTEEQGVDASLIKQASPVGMLKVSVLSASGLAQVGWHRQRNAFVRVSVGPEFWRSSTIHSDEPAWGSGDTCELLVYDYATRVHIEALDEPSAVEVLASDTLLGRSRPLSLEEALASSGKSVPISADDFNGNDSNASGRHVTLQYEWFELSPPGDMEGDTLLLVAKIDEVFLPRRLGSSACVCVKIARENDGTVIADACTPVGQEPKPGATEAAVENSMIGVAKRCHDLGLEKDLIAHISGLDLGQVSDVCAKLPVRQAGSRQIRAWSAPPKFEEPESGLSLRSLTNIIFCRKRARGGSSGSCQSNERDIEAVPLTEAEFATPAEEVPSGVSAVRRRDKDGAPATATVHEQVLLQLDIEAMLFLRVPRKYLNGTTVEITLLGAKKDQLASLRLSLTKVAAAPGHTLAGPLWLAPKGGGTAVESQVRLSLRGFRPGTLDCPPLYD